MLVKNWKLWGPIGSTAYPGAPTSVAVADLNGDGYLDAVVAGTTRVRQISVLITVRLRFHPARQGWHRIPGANSV